MFKKEVNHHRLLCGFASVDAGTPITRAAQEAKLRLVVELAQDVWGEGNPSALAPAAAISH
jgi:hypothetical protein